MYQFSAPMPYTKDDIQKLLDINNQVEKSRITSLYACVPRGCEVFTGFEQSRNFAFDNLSWDYWKRLINQTFDCNCEFIYLLNSPRPLEIENPYFSGSLETLELLLTELKKIGVKKLRVASAQLMSYIAKHHNDFDILASTSLEYKTIWEYQNFIHFHPEVKQIVPSHDVNKNFLLLKNLRKKYPKTEIELMVNEGCLGGCPNRMLHEYANIDKQITVNNDIYLSERYSLCFCRPVTYKFPYHSLLIGNIIFPWDIKEYSKIGINNFKLVGRDGYNNFEYYLNGFKVYLKGIDDIKSVENCNFAEFIHHLNDNSILKQLKIKDYKKYLPDINYFKKFGHFCNSICSVQCRYCYKCAEKMKKRFEKNNNIKRNNDFIEACKI